MFSLRDSDRECLSWRSRAFIRVHHVAVACLIMWIAYLALTHELF